MHSVMINIAMEAEAAPFIEHLGLTLDEMFFPSEAPFLAYTGNHRHAKVTVITNGKDSVYGTGLDNVGTIAAATASFLAVQKARPDLLVNAGTSGGFVRKGAAVGDVFLTAAAAFHHRRIPIPGFDVLGVGKLETTFDDVAAMAKALGFKTGVVTTSDSLDKTEKCDDMMLQNDASVKDMEAAAIAWVAKMHSLPFLGIKVVTDIVDGDRPTQEEFLENLATAAQKLQASLPQVIDYLLTDDAPKEEL
jgi:5'-methylthioadenosine nucleosidase